MKLHSSVYAPNPKRVRVYAAEKGIALDVVEVNIVEGEQHGDAFRAKNPMRALPVLELDDGRCFSESQAIIEYLEELNPQPPMIGRTPEERLRVRMLERICELGVMMNIGRYLWNTHPFWKARVEQVDSTAALALRHAHGALKVLDGYIDDKTFVAGDFPTVADCTLYAALDFGRRMSVPVDLSKRANVQRWLDTFGARPSAKA